MTARAADSPPTSPQHSRDPAPLDVFKLRCEARAILVAEGEMDFHEAIDGLQAAAVAYGLVAELGQDFVQSVMAEAFRPYREVAT